MQTALAERDENGKTLISKVIDILNENERTSALAKTLTDMYESISRAYVYLSLVQDKEAKAFVDAYNEVMLTVSVYNGNVQKVTTDMAAAFKQLFAPVYKLIPKNIVKELLDFIIKNFE